MQQPTARHLMHQGSKAAKLMLLDATVATLKTDWPLIMINIYHRSRERKDEKAGTRRLEAMYGRRNLRNLVESGKKSGSWVEARPNAEGAINFAILRCHGLCWDVLQSLT